MRWFLLFIPISGFSPMFPQRRKSMYYDGNNRNKNHLRDIDHKLNRHKSHMKNLIKQKKEIIKNMT